MNHQLSLAAAASSGHGAARNNDESRPSDLKTPFSGFAFQVQMTPPETPTNPHYTEDPVAEQTRFYNYLRALYHFDPSTTFSGGESDDPLTTTVVIKPGDIILVHSVHENGWADGTVLATGERGWLPTNYCEAYDHPYLRDLLNGMTQFWDILGANEDANLSHFVRQDYIRGLIAGVRYLLEHADCLHRDTYLVQQHIGIRRMRKGLLADLSGLVQIAKSLQDTISEPFAGEIIHYLIEDLMAKAFKVITRAVSFVDVWSKETAEDRLTAPNRTLIAGPLTPPSDVERLRIDTHISKLETNKHPIDSAKFFIPNVDEQAGANTTGGAERTVAAADTPQSALPVSRHRKSSLAHRLSLVEAERSPPRGLASEQLAHAHDACISTIGAFIGHHLHARPSLEFVETIERLVKACEGMLVVVDAVYHRDSQRSVQVRQARRDFQSRLNDLVSATKDVFTHSDQEDGELLMMPDQSTHLITVGTSLIRSSGDCVAKTRNLIEKIGDFEFGQLPLISHDLFSPKGDASKSVKEVNPSEIPSGNTARTEENLAGRPVQSVPAAQHELTAATFPEGSHQNVNSTATTQVANKHKSLPPAPQEEPVSQHHQQPAISGTVLRSKRLSRATDGGQPDNVGISLSGSAETCRSSNRNSCVSTISQNSTRATSPDRAQDHTPTDPTLLSSFNSISSTGSDAEEETEAQLLHKTYANELVLNKDGQVTGGSLPALVEKLTTHDTAPDAQFVTAFYITFRMFTTPRELAQTLISRFDYIGDSKEVGTPARLRIYNIFKGWLETYWNPEADKDALGEIRYFALHRLKPHLPPAGERLAELVRKLAAGYHTGTINGPLVSGVGKTSLSVGLTAQSGKGTPEPIIHKSQIQTLRSASSGETMCSVTDFDAVELARQITLIASAIFRDILPEELLSLEWNKKASNVAQNVRNMCGLNNDLAHLVADSVLEPDDAKKRSTVIKHWVKVAGACLELSNYDSLMAIMCTLNSSVVQRLRRTWEQIPKKVKSRLEELNTVIDIQKNHASLRKRLEDPVVPCIPFLGIYLTDLTFLDVGNPKTRDLPGAALGQPCKVINFDKYVRMAKVVSHLQRFQVPFRLQPIQEMQDWIDRCLQKMRDTQEEMVTHLHRRSLWVEPKQDRPPRMAEARKGSDGPSVEERPRTASGKERFESFLRSNTFGFKAPEMPGHQ
ncbi:ras GEF [Hortaea werneckii]|uniref:Ras-GEF domain-containing protein n=1 Tax=Hortaea werneckii TaxID=91943 RepID=A0A3M7GVV0_HORWE